MTKKMTLYGTTTSPYVRRVRVVALELGIDSELVDTFSDDGQRALRALNPIWKVPAARIDDLDIFDSGVITRYLLRSHGPGPLAPFDPDDVHGANLLSVIDGALDALINAFYLAKDGIRDASYLDKQQARAASAMSWLDARVSDGWHERFGLTELALYTAVDWMRFRHTYDPMQHHTIARFVEAHGQRESLQQTAPR